ncbi:hypothetical protein [Nocardia mikamii]|uniref:hypothetical protein n=1 Tax=Nocardia mikamii TaxID=508464 RepID=UPI0007A38778|nr:hypothetical protein [Nocardia mikamii]
MSGELRLDLAGLRERGARLSELADRVGQTYAGLRDCLDQARGSWGDDYMGRQFAEQFTPHADQMLANVRAMEKGLHSTASGIIGVADEFDAQDAGNAARLTDAAGDQAPGSGSSSTLRPDDAAGPPSPADTGTQVPYDPAASSPARNPAVTDGPAQRAGGAQRAEQPPAGGSQSPNGSPGRTVPQEGAQSRSPWNQDRPTSDPSGQDGRRPAGDAGRRSSSVSAPPPSSSAPPPADRRAAPRATDASSGGRAAPTRRGDTPWGGQPPRPSGTPGRTESPGKPGSPGRPESNPRHGSPPRSDRSSRDKERGNDRRRSREQGASDPMIGWLARTVAERHGVEVTGFDTPGLQLSPIRDFLAAVDRVLTDYPMIQLNSVAVAELDGEHGTVRWSREPGDEGATSSMTLDLRTAQEPAAVPASGPGGEPVRSDLYPATLREFGRALDDVGGGVARKQAQRVLIGEYLRREPQPDRTLAEVVSGYRDWRAGIAGKSAAPGEFDVGQALGTAFAEVVQHGAEAGIQARLLHAVLVAAASRPA